MKDESWGNRDSRGEWLPDPLPRPAALFAWPWSPIKALLSIWQTLWPYNVVYIALAVITWLWFTPSAETTTTFAFGWIALIYVRDLVLVTLVAGSMHLRLYVAKGQGKKFKYNDNWLAKGDRKYLFGNQTWDNIFWNLTSGCLVWTAYEALTLWAFSNKLIPFVDARTHLVYSIILLWAITYMRYAHFFFVHWLIHWKPLYRISHYLHHKNINIGPWSGLSMHPIEHILYYSGVFLHWILPSSPLHAIFHLMHAGISPALGHNGFHVLVTRGDKGLLADHYFHYLHHRYFTVNFGTQDIPLDWWFGTHHDGTPESQDRLLAARKRRSAASVGD